jgi:hypothetical protein
VGLTGALVAVVAFQIMTLWSEILRDQGAVQWHAPNLSTGNPLY